MFPEINNRIQEQVKLAGNLVIVVQCFYVERSLTIGPVQCSFVITNCIQEEPNNELPDRISLS